MSANAYAPPAHEDGPPAGGGRNLLRAIAALSCALGALGLVGGVLLLGLLAANPPDPASALAEPRALFTVRVVLLLATLPLGFFLFGGGVMTLAHREDAGTWLRRGFTYGLVLDPLRLALAAGSAWWQWNALRALVDGPSSDAGLLTISVLGLLVVGGWTGTKLAFYVVGLWTLRRPDVQEHLT